MKRVETQLSAWLMAFALAWSGAANAQEITDAHLQAAWDAVRAVGADAEFDFALPDIAEQVQGLLIDLRPDLFRQIPDVVNEVALELVARRLDLNTDVARVWALEFTEQELIEITAFYASPTGRKFSMTFELLFQQTLQVLENWYERLAGEMRDRSLLKFQQKGIEF